MTGSSTRKSTSANVRILIALYLTDPAYAEMSLIFMKIGLGNSAILNEQCSNISPGSISRNRQWLMTLFSMIIIAFLSRYRIRSNDTKCIASCWYCSYHKITNFFNYSRFEMRFQTVLIKYLPFSGGPRERWDVERVGNIVSFCWFVNECAHLSHFDHFERLSHMSWDYF